MRIADQTAVVGGRVGCGIGADTSGSRIEHSRAVVPAPEREYPIDLTTALRLAEVENPRIAEARQRIGEALALQLQARVLLLPNLNVGTNLHEHSGNLQRSSGSILNVNQSSLYFGGGAGAIGTRTVQIPAVSLSSPLTEAFFEPLAARNASKRRGSMHQTRPIRFSSKCLACISSRSPPRPICGRVNRQSGKRKRSCD